MTRRPAASAATLPTEVEVLEFIKTHSADKREIAKHFGIKGNDRIYLKQLLKKLAEDGKIEKRGKTIQDASALPDVSILEVTGTDRDGDLVGEPVEWDEKANGKRPRILIAAGRGEAPGKGDRVLAKLEPSRDRAYPFRAKVIKKLSESGNRFLGVYRVVKGMGARIVPVDKKARSEFQVLPGEESGAKNGELVEVEIARDRGRGLVSARVRQRLGDLDDQRNVSLIAIHHHNIPNQFPERVMKEADDLKPFRREAREDLRHIPLLTIDPRDARDHDDAVWAEMLEDGGARIIVAIADVSAYVRPGSALDREARIRGNSVYFPDRVVPMLPERISNDLCSLREGEERPALACHMVFDKSGKKTGHHFTRAIMRSAVKLSYEDAQSFIDNGRGHVLLDSALKPLWAAYAILMKGRAKREPLELDLPERKLILDKQGRVERVVIPLRLDAHKLIEEFMIQANVAAAEELERLKTPLIYRVHEQPAAEKLVALAQFLKTVDIAFPLGKVVRPSDFNKILAQAAGKDYAQLVNQVVLRSQAQAVYTPLNKGHFGLTLRRYAHFTSPIRRYADLIVHRALITALNLGDDGLSQEDIANLKDTSELISGAERRAMAAERETTDRLIAHHLMGQTGVTFHARIGGVAGAGLFVTLNDTGADGFVPVSTLGREYFVYDEVRHALIGEQTGDTYQLGDRVEVKLEEATPVSGGLKFSMVTPGRRGTPPRGRRQSGKRHIRR